MILYSRLLDDYDTQIRHDLDANSVITSGSAILHDRVIIFKKPVHYVYAAQECALMIDMLGYPSIDKLKEIKSSPSSLHPGPWSQELVDFFEGREQEWL